MDKFHFEDIDQELGDLRELIDDPNRAAELRADDRGYYVELLKKKEACMRGVGQSALFELQEAT